MSNTVEAHVTGKVRLIAVIAEDAQETTEADHYNENIGSACIQAALIDVPTLNSYHRNAGNTVSCLQDHVIDGSRL